MSQALKATSSDYLAKRLAAIEVLCATRGTQYQGLKNYRSL